MKRIKLIRGLIVSIILLWGCSSNISYEKEPDSLLINIDDIRDNLVDTIIYSDVNYVFLETSEESFIGNIHKILYNENYYVLDKNNLAVLVFSNDGAFLSKIHRSGRGPGEYYYLTDFDIDSSGNVYIYNHQSGHILKYDVNGIYLETYNTITDAEQMAVYDSTCIIFNQVTLDNNNVYQLVSLNLLNMEMTILLEARDVFDTEPTIPDFTSHRITKHNSNLYYAPPFSNLIYRIEPNKVTIACELIPSKYFMDKNTVRNVLNIKLSFDDYPMICQIRNYFETEDYIYLWFKHEQFYGVFYSKKSKKIIYTGVGKYKPGFPLSNIIGATNEEYIGKLDAIILDRMNSRTPNNLPKELQSKGFNSNPVIIRYKLKQF